MSPRRFHRMAAVAIVLSTTLAARADVRPGPSAPPPARTNLRAHLGAEYAARLVRSADPDERLRGIERVAALGTREAIVLLADAVERGGQLRADSRALLASARALAPFAAEERARAGLLAIVSAGDAGRPAGPAPVTEAGDAPARAELAREEAAIALARTGGDRALDSLYGLARSGGSGQHAALVAISRHPPRDRGFFGTTGTSTPAPVLRLLGQLGDLRALDVLHAAARTSDVGTRSAALVALAELGDRRATPLARAAIAESDVRLRAAAGEALVLLTAPERIEATAALIADEPTTAIGLRLADRVFGPQITRLVAARAWTHPDRQLRRVAIRALGRSPDPAAASALVAPQLLGDDELAYDALHALARSPAPNAGELVAGQLRKEPVARLAARAYVVRALVRGERRGDADDAVFALVRSPVGAARALGAFAHVALGESDVAAFLDDRDPRVRRAAILGAMASAPSAELDRALLARIAREPDPATRQLLALGLRGGDPDGLVKTSALVDRAESAGGDAALAAFALARRADDDTAPRIDRLLASPSPVLRAHAARGLGAARLADASGRLSDLYAYETDVEVRRAIVAALAGRTDDAGAPARRRTLELAATLDPDGAASGAAARALSGASPPVAGPRTEEVAWLRVTRPDGGAPGEAFVGALVRADGLAVPIAFDDDGYALVPGLPPGETRLLLAPRLPPYKEAVQ